MLILPRSCFIHVPKTGGSWVKRAILASGLVARAYELDGDPHIGIAQCPCPEKFRFAFVRHPLDLYRSYWQYKMTCGWDVKNPLDMACRSLVFHGFVGNVLDRFPGVYSQALVDFVGEAEHPIEFIGRFENLEDDLVTALTLAGESFDEDAIRAESPYNVSDKRKHPAEYTDQLEAMVREAEAYAMNRFNYR